MTQLQARGESGGQSHNDEYTAPQSPPLAVADPHLLLFDEGPTLAIPRTFDFIDLFAGIGGMRLAFEAAGGECAFSSEWDKSAQKTYYENFGEFPKGDITQISADDIPEHDVLVAGFPCQPFSIAGVSKKNSLGRDHGFMDKTQGTLFFDVARIIERKRPRAFLLENVKNLTSHDQGRTFETIKQVLQELDYTIQSEVRDARVYVPQHRERIYIVGFDNNLVGADFRFSFPPAPESAPRLGEILDPNPPAKYWLSEHLWSYLQGYAEKHKAKGNGFGYGLVGPSSVSRTLSARYYKDGSEILVDAGTPTPRRLTPRECARLMGFKDSFLITVADTSAYKQFGNSVVVPLVTDIAKAIAKELSRLPSKSPDETLTLNGCVHTREAKSGDVANSWDGYQNGGQGPPLAVRQRLSISKKR